MEKLKDTLLIDGAYFSEDIAKKAKARGIKMVPTNLVGGAYFGNTRTLFPVTSGQHNGISGHLVESLNKRYSLIIMIKGGQMVLSKVI